MYNITEEEFKNIQNRIETIYDIVFNNGNSKESEEFDKIESEVILIEAMISSTKK